MNENKSWFLEKISKIDKPLARLIKEERERAHINKIRNEKKKKKLKLTPEKYKGLHKTTTGNNMPIKWTT